MLEQTLSNLKCVSLTVDIFKAESSQEKKTKNKKTLVVLVYFPYYIY